MAARTSAAFRGPRFEKPTPEEAARRAVSGAQPSLDEILSLWPADRHDRIVLWVKLGEAGEAGERGDVVIGARPREQTLAGAPREVKRLLQRIRTDVPVVFELHDGGTVVVPLRALRDPSKLP